MKNCTIFLLFLATAASAQDTPDAPSRDAAAVLAEMKDACGGKAWDDVQGWHETGTVDFPGRPAVPYEIWHDMHALKTVQVNSIDGKVVRKAGFDGTAYWQVGPDGRAQIGQEPAKVRRHRRDAYLSSFGWFLPERFPAAITLAGSQTLDGKTYDVLRITPEAADSFDLWVDRDTHRVRKVVAQNEFAELTEYRMFGGVCSPTNGRQGDGDPANEIVLHVQTVETNANFPAAKFQPPEAAPAP
jgi:hypothetical protein